MIQPVRRTEAASRTDERGGGGVLTLALCLCLLTAAWAATVVVAWVGTARGAQNAADLAALAGAAAQAGGDDACRAATRAAQENGARVRDCRVTGNRHSFAVEVTAEKVMLAQLEGYPVAVAKTATAGTG